MQEDEGHTDKEPDKSSQALHSTRKRNDTIHMKILVPSGAVGAIIGKGGESIAQVQWETGARIKLSKPNDFYPGTVERVCLIQGTLEGVTRMHNYIMDRMLEKPECMGAAVAPVAAVGTTFRPPGDVTLSPSTAATTTSTGNTPSTTTSGLAGTPGTSLAWSQPASMLGSRLPWGRHQQVKILVPNCTAGLVIGKVGAYVKEIKDRTGAFIQISQKSKEINLMERCITIAGEPDQCRAAVALVLAKIAEDPQSTSCPTISYSRVQGPVASAYPTGSPFAFASVPRFPAGPGAGTSAHLVRDSMVPGAGYFPLVDPYASPMLQAALLQATALAATFNQRGAGAVGYYPPTACMTTSPPPSVPAQAGSGSQQAQPGSQSTSGQTQPTGPPNTSSQTQPTFVSPDQSPSGPDMGLYAAVPNAVAAAAAAQLLSGGGGLWTSPGGETSWATGESQIPGLAAAQAGYETSYPQMNFAYYPANQSAMLASLTSRHPSEASAAGFTGGGPIGPEFYPTSPPYATSVQFGPPGSTLRVTSPGANPAQLATVYQAANTNPSSLLSCGPADRMHAGMMAGAASTGQTATAQAIQLGDLFGSLRLGTGAPTQPPPAPYADFSPAEFGQAFATLSQHGLLSVPGLGAYSLFTSSTPVSSSGPIPIPDASRQQQPHLTMGPGRMLGAPTALSVAMGSPRDLHLFGPSGVAPRLRPVLDTEAAAHCASAQQPTLAVKRRGHAAATTQTGSDCVGLTKSVTADQLGPSKSAVRATESTRPASCYLPPTGAEPEQCATNPAVHSSSTSEDGQNEAVDQPLSGRSASDQSQDAPPDTPASSSQSGRSTSSPGPVTALSTERSEAEPITSAAPPAETNGNLGQTVKPVLNGRALPNVARTPNGVKK